MITVELVHQELIGLEEHVVLARLLRIDEELEALVVDHRFPTMQGARKVASATR